uniref:Uncharacterized protein n=1 Tax=Octopus bimaculoides TaxID=37653 RepID=A0A0L8HMG0_OCTBM
MTSKGTYISQHKYTLLFTLELIRMAHGRPAGPQFIVPEIGILNRESILEYHPISRITRQNSSVVGMASTNYEFIHYAKIVIRHVTLLQYLLLNSKLTDVWPFTSYIHI